MKLQFQLKQNKLVTLCIAMMSAVAISSCCSLASSDFCFNEPGRSDCPDGFIFASDNILDDYLIRSGRSGVVDREGRGGVVDRQSNPIEHFCLEECTTAGNCLVGDEVADLDVMTSNKIRYVVGDLHCSSKYIPAAEDPRFCSKQLK